MLFSLRIARFIEKLGWVVLVGGCDAWMLSCVAWLLVGIQEQLE